MVICDVVLLLALATCTRDCQCLIVVLNGLIDANNGFWHRIQLVERHLPELFGFFILICVAVIIKDQNSLVARRLRLLEAAPDILLNFIGRGSDAFNINLRLLVLLIGLVAIFDFWQFR